MNKIMYASMFLMLMILTGCGNGNGQANDTNLSLLDVETIKINHGSIKLELESSDQDTIEVMYDKSYGLSLDSGVSIRNQNREITIDANNRMVGIGRKPGLIVRIPSDYNGNIIINGSSGNMNASNFKGDHLEINTKSGNVSVDFSEFHSDTYIKTVSGNVEMNLNTEEPDVRFRSETGSGRQTVVLPLKGNDQQNHKKIEGESGKGTYEIQIKTTSGDIRVQ